MSARLAEPTSLRDWLAQLSSRAWLHAAEASVAVSDIASSTRLAAAPDEVVDRTVVIHSNSPLGAAIALIELDGAARRMLLCPPDLADAHLAEAVDLADAETLVSEVRIGSLDPDRLGWVPFTPTSSPKRFASASRSSQWVLFTSGTSGAPKMVVHTLASLAGAIYLGGEGTERRVWATFYDLRRYGGLQILLRALLGSHSLVLAGPREPMEETIERMAAHGATHVTGTPSHWRKALMSPALKGLAPRYVRLSGEIADQPLLDALKKRFPAAVVAHAFASTEAGVCCEIEDGQAGLPAALIDGVGGPVEMKIRDGTLRVRSTRTASGYLGAGAEQLLDADGFVDTGDILERNGDRYRFAGRRGGIINVGGLKAHPEEIEAVIGRHPAVRLVRVKGRGNGVTGQLVAAEVVLVEFREDGPPTLTQDEIRREILAECRASLAPNKVLQPRLRSRRRPAPDSGGQDRQGRCVTSSSLARAAASGWPLP